MPLLFYAFIADPELLVLVLCRDAPIIGR